MPIFYIEGNTPLGRLMEIIREDKHDLSVLLIYTMLSGILSLAIPLGAQALVNTIAAGVFLQPLFALSFLVLLGLTCYGILEMIELTIVETLQQRIFAKVAFRLAGHIPRIKESELRDNYAPDLVNRFFDTMTVQKGWAKILMQGPSSIFQILIGLFLMGLYSPYLFVFDLMVLLAFAALVLFGKGGVESSIEESTEKYNVAFWLEELARCHLTFKINSTRTYLLEQIDTRVVDYLVKRKNHFKVIFRQHALYLVFYALASTGLLAIGGWLVINQKLGLGQLVAAELVMLNILRATDALLSRLDTFYDLLASLDKIGKVLDLPTERTDGSAIEKNDNGGARIECRDLVYGYNVHANILDGLNLTIEPGSHVSLVGKSGVGKTTLASVICGLQDPHSGLVLLDGIDIRDYDLETLRSQVAFVSSSNEIFSGTIEDNIVVGAKNVAKTELQRALEIVEFTKDLSKMPKGLKTKLTSEGLNISLGQRLRILMARAVLKKPRLLILDEAFIGTDEKTKLRVLKNILSTNNTWTVVDISHDAESVVMSDRVYVLKRGGIVEQGDAEELANQPNSAFSRLFPELTRQIRMKRV